MADPRPEAPDVGFEPEDLTLLPWQDARRALEVAKTYWLSTVRPDGRPHVMPVWAVWLDDVLLFSTADTSRKGRNLAQNPRCAVSVEGDGLDLVLEGVVAKLNDTALLEQAVALYTQKYDWPVQPRDGGFYDEKGNGGPVYVVRPTVVFGFGQASSFSATRWVFDRNR
jgi:hypothetical protein